MQFYKILLTVAFTIASLACAIWLGKYGGALPVRASSEGSTPNPALPEVTEQGPQPKAVVVGSPNHKFGVMEYGSQGEQIFTIRNEGEGPLTLVTRPEDSTCQCTVSKFGEDGEATVAPGESVDVTLSWHIKSQSPVFRHAATIHTNDPENPEITLTTEGQVQQRLVLTPSAYWTLGEISDDKPTEVTGRLHSGIVESFNITEIESSNPLLSGTAVPIEDAATLEELGAKCGYRITLTLQPGVPVGAFEDKVTIRTDSGENSEFIIQVEGTRSGPLQILPAVGVRWYEDTKLLSLGKLSTDEGKKVTLPVYLKDSETDLQFSSVQADPDYIKLSLKPDPDFAGKRGKKYLLTIEIPPGIPSATRTRDNAAKVTIKTNLPESEALVIRISYIAL